MDPIHNALGMNPVTSQNIITRLVRDHQTISFINYFDGKISIELIYIVLLTK